MTQRNTSVDSELILSHPVSQAKLHGKRKRSAHPTSSDLKPIEATDLHGRLEAKMPWSYKKEVIKSYNCPTLHLRISLVAECCSNSKHHWRAPEQHQRNPEAQTMQQKLDLHAQCIVNHLACRPQGCRRPWHV